jgi:RNA polymerase sigma-70 factor (ECF subfamily)
MTTQATILNIIPTMTNIEPAPRVEALLIEQAKRDRSAFEPLYREHHEAIFRYLCRRTGSADAAADLAADVFLTAMLRIGSYTHRGTPFSAWLYRIATLKANRWARQRGRRRERPLGESLHLVGSEREESEHDVERTQRAMLSLPPKFQAALTLHYLEAMPVERVAQVINRPVGTVKSRLARARRALKRAIELQENSHA